MEGLCRISALQSYYILLFPQIQEVIRHPALRLVYAGDFRFAPGDLLKCPPLANGWTLAHARSKTRALSGGGNDRLT